MLIQFFKEETYDKLFGSVQLNLDWYNSDTATPEDIGLDSDSFESSSLDLQSFVLVLPPAEATNEEKSANDLINIKSVYGTWKELTPLLARNKYMWTYYCHCDAHYRSYIRARWMGNGFTESQATDRFFVTTNKTKLVRYNALSSLWWMGYLTYDEGAANPFWLTEVLGNATNLADFLDTYNSYNPVRAKGVIKGIAEVLDELGLDQLRNKPFRELNRYLNRYAAVVPLDYLSEDEIKALAKEELFKIIAAGGNDD